MTATENAYGSGLFEQHAALLRASAIPPDLARARKYVSIDTKQRLRDLGFSARQARVPGLLIPLHNVEGKTVGFQYRPDNPRENDNGRPIKYETPFEQDNCLDVPPGVGTGLADAREDLWVTEGARKADAAAHLGLACVSLSGVNNWRGKNKATGRLGKTALPDWHDVGLSGRRVVLAFDSDSRTNPQVARALAGLAEWLAYKGARVAYCHLPDSGDGKTGLDDYIAAGHGLDDLLPLVQDAPPPAATSDTAPGRDSAATALVEMLLERYRLGLSTDDEPFAVPKTGPRLVRPLRGGKGSLRSVLAADYYSDTGRAAPQQGLAEALQTVEGLALDCTPERLHLRVGEHDGSHYLDLGESTGRAVRLQAGRWEVIDAPPLLFRRTQLTGALPEPVTGGDLAELWAVLNVAAADRPLVLAWLISCLLTDVPHPILALGGEQGSGKSTATRTLAGLLDPSPAQTRKPPRDVEAWVTAAAGSWVVALDNVSTVPEWWSDALCRAVTGEGEVRRRLYSDADLTVFSFRRCVLLNGIDLGAVRDDLAERLLTVELHRITDTGRKLDADLARRWQEAHPRLLGALLDLAARVLAELPGLHLDRLPRMADFARVLAAVDRVLGSTALADYGAQAGDLAADAVDSDPVLSAIAGNVTELWQGSAAELLAVITPDREGWRAPKDWPKDNRTLTALLRRRAPSLRRLGWTVEDLGRGGKAMVVRFRLDPPDAEPNRQATRQATAPEAGDVACQAGDSIPRRLPTSGPLTCENAENGPEAGDAGDKYAPSLCQRQTNDQTAGVRGTEPTPHTDGLFPSPASPASPVGGVLPSHYGPCAGCSTPTVRYGPHGRGSLCPTCLADREAVSAGTRRTA